MKNLCERIVNVLEENEFKVCSVDKQDREYVSELEWFSPAGEDVLIEIFFDGTDCGFVSAFRENADNYDPDEHAEMWIEHRGTRGIPSSIRELIDDADAIGAKLNSVSVALENLEL